MRRVGDTEAVQKLRERLKADRERLWDANGGYIPPAPARPVCAACSGRGAYLRKRAGDHGSDRGDLVTCPDCLGQGIRDKDRIVESRRAASGMDHAHDVTFAATTPFAWQGEQYEVGRGYAIAPRSWLWMVGGVNTGKTRMAYCIGNTCLAAGQSVLFQDVPKLLDALRRGYQKDATEGFDEQMDRLFHVGVLILDDYGRQAGTEWAGEKLFQITNHRLERRLPTVVTTNLTMRQMDEPGSRLFQHVGQTDGVLLVNFPDRRPTT